LVQIDPLTVNLLLCAQIGEEDNLALDKLINYFDDIKYAGMLM